MYISGYARHSNSDRSRFCSCLVRRRRALRAEGSRRGGAISRAENILPIEPLILFASGTGSPEKSSVGTAALPSAGKLSQCDLNCMYQRLCGGLPQPWAGGTSREQALEPPYHGQPRPSLYQERLLLWVEGMPRQNLCSCVARVACVQTHI